MVRPAKGFAPSGAPVKLCSKVSLPEVSSLNTVPLSEQGGQSPPNGVVPYRLPALSLTKPATGSCPSSPDSPNVCSTVSLPEVSSLKTVPTCFSTGAPPQLSV